MNKNCINTLLEIAFSEMKETIKKQSDEIDKLKEQNNNLQTLVCVMDKKFDEYSEKITKLSNAIRNNLDDDKFYNNYKNGDD